MAKAYTYPRSLNITKDDKEVGSVLTQMYSAVGIYVCFTLNGNRDQMSMTPARTKKFMKELTEALTKDGYTVESGLDISITTDEHGMYVENRILPVIPKGETKVVELLMDKDKVKVPYEDEFEKFGHRFVVHKSYTGYELREDHRTVTHVDTGLRISGGITTEEAIKNAHGILDRNGVTGLTLAIERAMQSAKQA